MHIHPRSVAHKVFDVWRSPGRFTKNPDIIELPSGRLMLIYSDTDSHWSQVNQVLTLLASDDRGRTWFKHRENRPGQPPAGRRTAGHAASQPPKRRPPRRDHRP